MTNLFQFGGFTLSTGIETRLGLDCLAITPEEWHSLGRIALPLLPPYDRVVGVYPGGLLWAEILEHYIQPAAHRTLFVDAIWEGPDSIRRAWASYGYGYWHGLVLFARAPVPKDVTALFMLNERLQ